MRLVVFPLLTCILIKGRGERDNVRAQGEEGGESKEEVTEGVYGETEEVTRGVCVHISEAKNIGM